MTIIVKELRDALVEAGATYEKADAAAAAVVAIEHAATKQDIVELRSAMKTEIADLRSELYRALWLQAAGIVGVLSAVGALLKVLG